MFNASMTAVHLNLLAPVSGVIVPLESVPDPVFASKRVGDGIAIDPTSSLLLAPVAGTVTQLHPAHHALAITFWEGVEVLLHVGLDTVLLKGEGFAPKVAMGDRVEAGQPLLGFDPVLVGPRVRSLMVLMVIANGERVAALAPFAGLVTAGVDPALQVKLRDGGSEPTDGQTLQSRIVILPNRSGLHARPAAVLADAARKFSATIRLVRGAKGVNAKSLVAILGFEAKGGDPLQVRATGPDAREAAETLADLLAGGCGDGPGPLAAGRPAPGRPDQRSMPSQLAGVSAAPGIAVGRVFQFRTPAPAVAEPSGDPALDRDRLEAALGATGLELPEGCILIAEELAPSTAAQLDGARIQGLATTRGGPTGQVAILARSMAIPAICALDEAALELPSGSLVVLDGTRGILQLAPSETDLGRARVDIARQATLRSVNRTASLAPAVTADGFRLKVAANLRSAGQVTEAVAAGAEGIGLLRSEFLFHDRQQAPSEDEQTEAYGAVARALGPGQRLVIRTLNVGGDKPLAYLPMAREANPFLGLRGVRASLDRPELFRAQLRALLRVAPLADLHIMFPMIGRLEELRAARSILAEEAAVLGGTPKVGVMIELPSAALIADALAREADFFSIGTDDLTQHCLAMDRRDARFAQAADALHPSVLRLIGLTVASAHRHGKWVGVCGGLASDPLAVPALLGLGVDELSVSVPTIGAIKARIARLNRAECEILAGELLELGTAAEVRDRLAPF